MFRVYPKATLGRIIFTILIQSLKNSTKFPEFSEKIALYSSRFPLGFAFGKSLRAALRSPLSSHKQSSVKLRWGSSVKYFINFVLFPVKQYCTAHYPFLKSDVHDNNSSSTSHFTKCIQYSVFLEEDTQKCVFNNTCKGLVSASTTPWDCTVRSTPKGIYCIRIRT